MRSRIACASAFGWPLLRIGFVPPVESIRISDHTMPDSIVTDATLGMAMLSSLEMMMPAGTTWTRPTGGFYVWATLPSGLDAKIMQPPPSGNRRARIVSILHGGVQEGGRRAGTENVPLSYA